MIISKTSWSFYKTRNELPLVSPGENKYYQYKKTIAKYISVVAE
jgi:hypothetical protein